MKICLMAICLSMLISCIPPGGTFMINRSGTDKIIYIGEFGRNLHDGKDDLHFPLEPREGKLLVGIQDCPPKDREEDNCKKYPIADVGEFSAMVLALKEYQRQYGVKATYIIDKDNSMRIVPYDRRSKKFQ